MVALGWEGLEGEGTSGVTAGKKEQSIPLTVMVHSYWFVKLRNLAAKRSNLLRNWPGKRRNPCGRSNCCLERHSDTEKGAGCWAEWEEAD